MYLTADCRLTTADCRPTLGGWPNQILLCFLLALFAISSRAQSTTLPTRQDTLKGSITPERAWWDVLYYDLYLELDHINKTIIGSNTIEYEVVRQPHTARMQIDLQSPLHIDSVKFGSSALPFAQEGAVWWITTPQSRERTNKITIHYSGAPKESTNPPYDGGISWAKDSLARPWISVSCQMVGGSVWYPCKDHYSEEPDRGASVTLVVDDSLRVVGNGRLTAYETRPDGKSSYTWSVVNPINNYGLTFYVGHYIQLNETYQGEKGPMDMSYYVLDYNQSKAIGHLIPEVNKTMRAFEKWYGPYPFYEDGFKMVEASYIGMEHQSAVAYGNQFKKGRFKFKNLTALDMETDRLIVHEMAHEWFGNNITMSDIADRWVQEGFAAYGEELFIEELLGREAGRDFFISRQRPDLIKNKLPLISAYGLFRDAGPDMYFKGWAIIHMLREMVEDDEKFRNYLRALNQHFYHKNISSADLETFTSTFFETDYGPFFDQYLRVAALPVLEYRLSGNRLEYRLVANVEGLVMPVKLYSDPALWIEAAGEWRESELSRTNLPESLQLDPNFLLQLKQL